MDLTPLIAWLNSLGPWGVIAAVVITIAAPRIFDAIKKRFPSLTPATPTAPQGGGVLNPPDVVPLAPAGPLANRPFLNLLLLSLRQVLVAQHPGRDPEQLVAEYLTVQLAERTAELRTGPPAVEPKQ